MADTLRRRTLRLAASLPEGDMLRRRLLAAFDIQKELKELNRSLENIITEADANRHTGVEYGFADDWGAVFDEDTFPEISADLHRLEYRAIKHTESLRKAAREAKDIVILAENIRTMIKKAQREL